jgi:hypothetical protein
MSLVVFGLQKIEVALHFAFGMRNFWNMRGGSPQKRHHSDFSVFGKKGFSKHTWIVLDSDLEEEGGRHTPCVLLVLGRAGQDTMVRIVSILQCKGTCVAGFTSI